MHSNASSERFGAILGRPGAVLARLGAILGRRGAVVASLRPPQACQKTLKFLGFFNIFLNLNIFASLAVLEAFERVLRASWSHL